jgi:alpha-galactosidase
MGVRAALTGDVEMLKLAVLHDPLVGAICTPEEVWQMVDEMLVAQAKWLPQYAAAIPAAAQRLKTPKVQTHDWRGAARLNVRTVDELRVAKAAAQDLGTKIMG